MKEAQQIIEKVIKNYLIHYLTAAKNDIAQQLKL